MEENNKHWNDFLYLDYVLKFSDMENKTPELILISLNIMKGENDLTIREVLDKALFGLVVKIDNRFLKDDK